MSSNRPQSRMKAPRSMWRRKAESSKDAQAPYVWGDRFCHSSSSFATVSRYSPQATCVPRLRSRTFFCAHNRSAYFQIYTQTFRIDYSNVNCHSSLSPRLDHCSTFLSYTHTHTNRAGKPIIIWAVINGFADVLQKYSTTKRLSASSVIHLTVWKFPISYPFWNPKMWYIFITLTMTPSYRHNRLKIF